MYTIYFTFRCILSKFYIKPQLVLEALLLPPCCILSKFYIKPQLMMTTREGSMRCILSKFYIKPQRVHTSFENGLVVSYRNSTSNHNVYGRFVSRLLLYLIEILHQTTTGRPGRTSTEPLYLIEILHQTTTIVDCFLFCYTLYLIEILHQTTTLEAYSA